MIVTELSLVEYFDEILSKSKSQNYKWIISLIARHADAKKLYNYIEQDWASINDLTYDNVLFVFSLGSSLKSNSFFRTKGEKSYVGTICPYVETINEARIADNIGDYSSYIDREIDIDWKQKHSQSITEFIRKYDIREQQLPVLFVWDLEKDCNYVISLNQNENMYLFVKQAILEQTNQMEQIQKIEKGLLDLKKEKMYLTLYDSLAKRACCFPTDEKRAIQSILDCHSSYLEKKNKITDKKIRTDLKKIGQWRKHFFGDKTLNIIETKSKIDELLKDKKELENRISTIWEQIGNRAIDSPVKEEVNREENIIASVIKICKNLISNETYYGGAENSRNTYIRDMLGAMKYEVRDQTRHGLSSVGKDAGQVDISVLIGENRNVLLEALNLKYLNRRYIDIHLDKIFDYDSLGNEINIIINYVTVQNFEKFIGKYIAYMKVRKWRCRMIELDEECDEYKTPYSSIKVIKTTHIRNGQATSLYHISALVMDKKNTI